jgi:hypothetical protein
LREIPQNTHRNNKKGIVYVVHSYFGWKVQNNIRWVRSWSPSVSSDIGLGYQRRKTLYIKKRKTRAGTHQSNVQGKREKE